jgi:hypothetical protein
VLGSWDKEGKDRIQQINSNNSVFKNKNKQLLRPIFTNAGFVQSETSDIIFNVTDKEPLEKALKEIQNFNNSQMLKKLT